MSEPPESSNVRAEAVVDLGAIRHNVATLCARVGTAQLMTVVFGLIGYFLINAAVDYKPKESVGLDGALSALAQASYGPVLLGIVAAGLIAFGAYSMADARYRRV